MDHSHQERVKSVQNSLRSIMPGIKTVRSVTLTVGRLILLYKEPFLSLTKHEEDPLAIFIMTVVCLC